MLAIAHVVQVLELILIIAIYKLPVIQFADTGLLLQGLTSLTLLIEGYITVIIQ